MDVLRVGVIGTGAIGREHISRLQNRISGCRITAVSELCEETGKKVAEQYQVKYYRNGDDLIADPEVDAVVVTTADPAHAQFVLSSIRAGKYVFCEKPLATEISECKEIVEAEMKLGKRIVQVGFMRRFDPGYTEMKKLIRSGLIGEPLMVHACHRNMTHAMSMTSDMSIKNSGIHEIDIMRWLLDDDYSTGQVILPRHNAHADPDLQDPQIMLLRTKKGIAIDVEIAQNSGYGYDIQCEVVGELGTVKLPDPPAVQKKTCCSKSSAILPGWETRFLQAYDIELETWVNEVRHDKITGPSSWDGYAACLTAAVLGECRKEQVIKAIPIPECPDFYR